MEYLPNDHEDCPNQHKNSHKLCDSRFKFDGKSMKIETTTLSDFPNGGKAIVEQILASEETNKSKRAGL